MSAIGITGDGRSNVTQIKKVHGERGLERKMSGRATAKQPSTSSNMMLSIGQSLNCSRPSLLPDANCSEKYLTCRLAEKDSQPMVSMSSCCADKPRDKSMLSNIEQGICDPKKEKCVSAGPASGLGFAAFKTARERPKDSSLEMVALMTSQDDELSEYFTLPACTK